MGKKILVLEYLTQPEIREALEQENLTIASIYRRILAYILDLTLTLFLTSVLMVPLGLAYSAFGLEKGEGEKLAKSIFIFWALLVFPLYYAFSSLIFTRTLGCWISGIRIVRMSGERVGFIYGFLRGFLIGTITVIWFPILIIVHTLLTLFDWRGNRLKLSGWDAASRTMVVESQFKSEEYRHCHNRRAS